MFFFRRLDRTDVDDFFLSRVRHALVRKCDDANND